MQLLIDESAIERPAKVAAADRARAMRVRESDLRLQYSDEQVARLSKGKWQTYQRVLRSRGVPARELMRLAGLRELQRQKDRCPGQWNPKTGCRERDWYMVARDTGQHAVQTVARSPITQAALTVASFTPLAPIALGTAAGLQVADAAVSGRAVDLGTVARVAGSAVGVPRQATELGIAAVNTIDQASRGNVDWTGLAAQAAGELGAPRELIDIGTATVRGDWHGAAGAAVGAAGIELPQVRPELLDIGTAAVRGDWQGAAGAAAGAAGVQVPSELSRAARAAQAAARRDARGVLRAAGVQAPALPRELGRAVEVGRVSPRDLQRQARGAAQQAAGRARAQAMSAARRRVG